MADKGWPSSLDDGDLELLGRGEHPRLWEVLGAHPRRYRTGQRDAAGTSFAVWAPHARSVDVIVHGRPPEPLAHRAAVSGAAVWETFLPGVRAGDRYYFRVTGPDGTAREKADPMARARSAPAGPWSTVVAPSRYQWHDSEWMANAAHSTRPGKPLSIYEVHLASWRAGATYRGIARELVDYVRNLGFTHVELLPITEHPYGGSWGYQVASYFAPTCRLGEPDDLRHLVDACHRAGIGVLLDWVPAHFAVDEWALSRLDGTPLYEPADSTRSCHPEWGTYLFDYSRPQVRNFLIASALYWLEEFHIDGLRVDAVTSILYHDAGTPNDRAPRNVHGGRERLDGIRFVRALTDALHRRHPHALVIAEENTLWPGVTAPVIAGGLGFDYAWNLGWSYQTLSFFASETAQRPQEAWRLAEPLSFAWNERFVLPLSHDDVSPGHQSLDARIPADASARLPALYAVMWASPGKKLLFMGQEFGQPSEWADWQPLSWQLLAPESDPRHCRLSALVARCNRLYRALPALHSRDTERDGYVVIGASAPMDGVLCFGRSGSDGSLLVCVANLGNADFPEYRIGLPLQTEWREVLRTDGPLRSVRAQAVPWQGQPASATLRLAAGTAVWIATPTGTQNIG